MSGLIFGQVVHVVEQPKPDRWKRVLGVVFVNDGLNVNREMVALGYAWVYPKHIRMLIYLLFSWLRNALV